MRVCKLPSDTVVSLTRIKGQLASSSTVIQWGELERKSEYMLMERSTSPPE